MLDRVRQLVVRQRVRLVLVDHVKNLLGELEELGRELAVRRRGRPFPPLAVLGLGEEDATRERGENDVAAAESRWRAVEAENRGREMAAEMERQKRLAETRRRRLESAGAVSAPPASPPTPSRTRNGSQSSKSASPRVSGNAGSGEDARAADEDGSAMKELKDYAADEREVEP